MNSDERLFPYYFVVEIEGIQGARFKKCSGLEIHTNIIEIEEGGYNCSTRKFTGGTSYNNIILEHGITNNNDLYNWCFYSSLADNERERKNGSIVLMNLAGEEIKRWNFFRAFPCRWVGPALVAGLHGEYAIEKVEIALEELRVDSDENEENLQVAVNENEEELQADSVESEVEVVPTYFTQGQWADDFDQEFANNACTATSLLNEISEEYTRHTGTAMTFEQGVAAM